MKRQKPIVLLMYFLLQGSSIKKSSTTYQDIEYSQLKKQYPWLNRAIFQSVIRHSQAEEVNSDLVLAVINAESYGNPQARGPFVRVKLNNGRHKYTRALGLMQVIPDFHYKKKRHELFRVDVNIQTGVKVLKQALKDASHDLAIALKNYNSGPHSNYYNWKYIHKVIGNMLISEKNRVLLITKI